MVGGKFKCGYANHRRSRPYYSRKCKEKSGLTIIDSLPDDLLFHILLELPAQDIYDGARLVCKKWHNIIRNRRFVYEHLHRSTPGLLIRYCCPPHDSKVFMAMRQGKVEISKLTYKFKEGVWASCNGLTVEPASSKVYSPYITNPATKQCLALPQVTPLITEYYSVIAYDASSMQYKVVLNLGCEEWTLPMHNCLILTVGVDKSWRRLQIAHVPFPNILFFMCVPLVTGGFIHWTNSRGFDVLTLNVETEIFTHNPVPQGYNEKSSNYYLSTGRSLTLVIEHGEFSWEVLKMKSETGEWTELSVIDLEPRKDKIRSFFRKCSNARRVKPVGWLNYEEVLVFHIYPTRNCVLYNVRTREIVFFELDYGSEYHSFTAHRNTLVPLAGC